MWRTPTCAERLRELLVQKLQSAKSDTCINKCFVQTKATLYKNASHFLHVPLEDTGIGGNRLPGNRPPNRLHCFTMASSCWSEKAVESLGWCRKFGRPGSISSRAILVPQMSLPGQGSLPACCAHSSWQAIGSSAPRGAKPDISRGR